MARRLPSTLLVGILVAACGTAQPSASPIDTLPGATSEIVTEAPSAATTPGAATATPTTVTTPGPFDGHAYAMDLPEGWVTFDLSDPVGVAALDAFVEANPDMAAAIEAFKALPNVTMAVNQLLGNVVISLSVPTGGVSLEVVTATMTTQFSAVPGIVGVPVPEPITLPAGPAVHWDLTIRANDPSGATYEVGESIYLVANDTTAVLVEFVEAGGVAIPQEAEIIQSLRFTP
jgi:hypothetical protein